MKTLQRLLELKFDFGISLFLDENQYSTLYRIERDNANITLYFDRSKQYPLDPKGAEWVDVTDLQNFQGVYFDADRIHPSGSARHWLSSEYLIFFAICDSTDKDE